ncbi:MAG: hypothetical protein KDD38_07410 [Bdellovibrionales bacterium]|nr:hypothetical protein [Bdellovibrionales bacterium]
MKKLIWPLLSLAFYGTPTWATEFNFSSKLDRFAVNVTDSGAIFNGEKVSLEPFMFIKPLFDAQFEAACPDKIGRPDLTITRIQGNKEEKRIVYIDKKVISDGKNCGSVTGHGIYQLPLHRNWFEGKKTVTIGLGDSFSVWKDGRLVVEFDKTDFGWRNKDRDFFTNWEFFNKFLHATKDFPIDFRVHPSAAKEYTSFELRQGGRKFTFVKVGETTWAVQFPGSPWLAASGNFGIFEDMSQRIWISPLEKTLRIIRDPLANLDTRTKALRELSKHWGPDLNYVLREVVLTGGDNVEIKKDIVNLLRSRPTDENFKVLVDVLKTSTDQAFLYTVTKALRVRNPKGPIILETDHDDVVKSKINEWTLWRRQLKD